MLLHRHLCLLAALIGCAGGTDGEPTTADSLVSSVRGADVVQNGVSFGVWAPHADRVFVAGTFNGWRQTNELARTGDIFSGVVPNAVAGNEYKYVIRRGSQALWRADPRARQMRGEGGNSVIVDPKAYEWNDAGFVAPPLGEQVIYEMHVPSFGGDFRSSIDRLDHLEELGINVIEMLPPQEYTGDRGGWGYKPVAIHAPETDYGTPEDLKAFIDMAHQRGIAVIVDWVPNHMSASDTSMHNFDGASLGAYGIYYYADAKKDTNYGPRPNYDHPEVASWLYDSFIAWLDDYHFDGSRVDSTLTMRRHLATEIPAAWSLMRRVNDAAHARGKIMIAEDLQSDPALTRSTAQGGAGFDSQWDDDFYWDVKRAVIAPTDGERQLWRVRDAIARASLREVIYTENHDKVAPHHDTLRIPKEISPASPGDWAARKRSTLAASLLLTAPGLPMLFQGQELLEDQDFVHPVPPPLDWSKKQTYAGIFALYRDLISLRTTRVETRGLRGRGVDVFHVNENAKVLAYRRWDRGGDDVVVVANFSARSFPAYTIGFPRSGLWRVRFNGDSSRYSPDFSGATSNPTTAIAGARDGQPYRADVGIGPYTAIVLSQ